MKPKKVYITNLVITLGFSALYYFTRISWLLLPVVLVPFFSLISFNVAEKIASTWMLIGKTIGGFNARILLSILFIALITPIGLLRKLVTKKSAPFASNWKASQKNALDFTRPF